MPSVPSNPGDGLRQRRAAELRAEMEAARQQPPAGSAPESSADPDSETPPSPSEEYQGTGPVGQGDYVVKQGDCISSIAKDTGHFWETIWNDPANAELKGSRQDPNVLRPDDHVTIPDLNPKKEPGETEMRHRFVRKGEPLVLRIRVLDNAQPLSNQPYTLETEGGSVTGTTDAEGKLACPIPGNARRGRLLVGTDEDQREYEFLLGELDPVVELTGLQHRLSNLGFDPGGIDGIMGPRTRAAIRQFQAKYGLPISGEPDDQTRGKLREVHGS